MADAESSSSSKTALTAVLITGATLVLFAGILVPPRLRERAERQRAADLTSRVQPILEALIAAEAPYKERESKFWRDKEQMISPEAAKQALGVDISPAQGFRFSIAPPDLVADPTLRVEAKGTGEAEGFTLVCVYDSIQKSKSCKIV